MNINVYHGVKINLVTFAPILQIALQFADRNKYHALQATMKMDVSGQMYVKSRKGITKMNFVRFNVQMSIYVTIVKFFVPEKSNGWAA